MKSEQEWLEEEQIELPVGAERHAVDEMLEDSVFLDALTYNVDSAVHVQNRFDTVDKSYRFPNLIRTSRDCVVLVLHNHPSLDLNNKAKNIKDL